MSKLFKFLSILRILDHTGVLSLTNVALIFGIIKFGINPATIDNWLLILTTIGSYQFKRWYTGKKDAKADLHEARFKSLEDSLSNLKSIITLRK